MLNKYLLDICVSCADCYPCPCLGAGEDQDPHRSAARHHGPGQALRHHQLNVSLYLCAVCDYRIFISGTAVNNKRFMTILVYCVLRVYYSRVSMSRKQRRSVHCAGLCRAINRPISILCNAFSGCLSHLCSVLCRSRYLYYYIVLV